MKTHSKQYRDHVARIQAVARKRRIENAILTCAALLVTGLGFYYIYRESLWRLL